MFGTFLMIVTLLLSIGLHLCLSEAPPSVSDEKRLLDDLFTGYDKRVRPISASNNSLPVYMQFWLISVTDLNERLEQLTTVGWIEMDWRDDWLSWNPDDYGQLQYVVVKVQDIWYPDIVIRNSIDEFYGDILDTNKYRVIIQSDGTIHFFTAGSITTSCVLDLTYFPFDEQACYIHLDSWTYSITQVSLRNISSVLNTDRYQPNGQWQLVRTHVSCSNVIEDGDTYVHLRFIMYLTRKPEFYTLTLVMPCALMSAMVLFVFLLPVDASEKVSLSATVLLSFSVFQLLILDIMPQTSDYTPVMTIYITCVMFLAGLSLVSTVLVLRLHHSRRPVPQWLHSITKRFLAKVVCVKLKNRTTLHASNKHISDPCHAAPPDIVVYQTTDDVTGRRHIYDATNRCHVDDVTTRCHLDDVPSRCHVDEVTRIRNCARQNTPQHDLLNVVTQTVGLDVVPISGAGPVLCPRCCQQPVLSEVYVMMESILRVTQTLAEKLERKRKKEVNASTWHDIARVFDQLFLIVYVVLTVVVGAFLLGIYPQVGQKNFIPIHGQ